MGGYPAAQQVSHLEAQQVGGRGPAGHAFHFGLVDRVRDGHEAVDEAVEVDDHTVLEVVDDLGGELSADPFVLVEEGGLLRKELALQDFELLLVEVGLHVGHVPLDLGLLVLQQLLEGDLDPVVEDVYLLAVEGRDALRLVDVVVLVLELAPELLAPLGHDPQDLGGFGDEVAAPDLLLAEAGHAFGYFSANVVVGVLVHLLPVLLHFLDSPQVLVDLFILDAAEGEGGLPVEGVPRVGPGLLLHPERVVDLVEELGHVVVKVFEVGHLLVFARVDAAVVVGDLPVGQGDDLVQDPHDDVVVVAVLAIPEGDVRVVEEVVGEHLHVVNLLDGLVEDPVGMGVLAEGVLQGQVGHHLVLHYCVYLLEKGVAHFVGLRELPDVAEDCLAAEDLGLLEGHVLVEVVVEGGGDDVPADLSDPLLDALIVLGLLLGVLVVGLHDPVPGLEAALVVVVLLLVGEVERVPEDVLDFLQDGVGLVGVGENRLLLDEGGGGRIVGGFGMLGHLLQHGPYF